MTELTQAYKTIIDALPDIVIVLDEGGCVVDINKARQMSDIVPSSILGKPLAQFISFAGFQHVIDTQDRGYHEFERNSHSY